MPLLTIFALIVLIVVFLQSRTFKGLIGESTINHDLNFKLDKNEYHLIKDISLPALGNKTQIEHMIVSPYGIFIIETKYMKGWIYGDEQRKEWTQKLPSRKFAFPYPLLQNNNHIKALAYILHLSDDKFHSVIAFTGKSIFKSVMPDNVIDKDYIEYIKSKSTLVFTKQEVEEYISRIKKLKKERSRPTSKKQIVYLRQPYRS